MKKITALILSLLMVFSVTATALASEESLTKPYDNSEFFTTGDYTLHYRVYNPDGEVKNQVLLVHGFCLSTASLEGIAEEYAKAGYRVVTVDAPDFGYSSRENSATRLQPREELIFSLAESLGGTWIVGGHSMGGGIALNLACDHPEIFTGLVLYAPQSVTEMTGAMKSFARSPLMQTLLNGILKLALRLPFLVRMLVEMSFNDGEYARAYSLDRITAPLSVEGTGSGLAIMMSHARGADFEKIAALDIPAAVITAKEDKVANAAHLAQILDALGDNATVYECEKGGHMMMEYNPALVAEKTLPVMEICK